MPSQGPTGKQGGRCGAPGALFDTDVTRRTFVKPHLRCFLRSRCGPARLPARAGRAGLDARVIPLRCFVTSFRPAGVLQMDHSCLTLNMARDMELLLDG